jgi:alpha-tubulin suppressor-like RCC1 family protein
VAIQTDGSLWAWGSNYFGQLGDGGNDPSDRPKKVGDGFASVVSGDNHVLAIKTDGSLWVWGENEYGQLGDGTVTDSHSQKKLGDGFASAAVGDTHSLAIRVDGSLWAWGANYFGQLGVNTTEVCENRNACSRTPKLVVASGFGTTNDFASATLKTTATTAGSTVTISWTPVIGASGYTFYFAPYPGADYVNQFDVGTLLALSADLPAGSAFYVAIQAYDAAGRRSAFSNVTYFVVKP